MRKFILWGTTPKDPTQVLREELIEAQVDRIKAKRAMDEHANNQKFFSNTFDSLTKRIEWLKSELGQDSSKPESIDEPTLDMDSTSQT